MERKFDSSDSIRKLCGIQFHILHLRQLFTKSKDNKPSIVCGSSLRLIQLLLWQIFNYYAYHGNCNVDFPITQFFPIFIKKTIV